MEVIECNTEAAIESIGETRHLKAKTKWLKAGLLRLTR